MNRSVTSRRIRRRAHVVAQGLLMPALAAHCLKAPRGPGSRRLLAAQAFSWGGDLALTGAGRKTFLAGLGSFLAAQLAYVSAYRGRSSAGLLATPGRRSVLVAGTAAASGMAVAAGREDPVLAAPVAAYGVALVTMVAAAACVDSHRGRDRVLAGAWLFLVSDTLIGVRKFLGREDSSALQAGVMATYTAAQCCISDGLTRG